MTEPNMSESGEDLVTVATFNMVPEAEMCKLRLETSGITVFLADASTVNMDWLIGNAIGCVKVQVPAAQAEAAEAAIERMRAEQAADEDDDVDRCLECGAAMPEEADACPACGWTYAGEEEEEEESA